MTSPPYLNAIDYLRGHKLSLVWMGHSISEIRRLRSSNVGAEVVQPANERDAEIESLILTMCEGALEQRNIGILRRYIQDMREVMQESFRVLKPGGKAVYVVGNCNLRDTFVKNSKCISELALETGFEIHSTRTRPLPENRRYLPPPETRSSGKALRKRMREEVILTLLKPKPTEKVRMQKADFKKRAP